MIFASWQLRNPDFPPDAVLPDLVIAAMSDDLSEVVASVSSLPSDNRRAILTAVGAVADNSAVAVVAIGGFDRHANGMIRWELWRLSSDGVEIATDLLDDDGYGRDGAVVAACVTAAGELGVCWATDSYFNPVEPFGPMWFETVAPDGVGLRPIRRRPIGVITAVHSQPPRKQPGSVGRKQAACSGGDAGWWVVWPTDKDRNDFWQLTGRFVSRAPDVGSVDSEVVFEPINTAWAGQQVAPCVAALGDGSRSVVGWMDDKDRNGLWQLRARILHSDGAMDPEFVVNEHPAGDQVSPGVAELSDGGLVFVWLDDPEADGWAWRILVRVFDSDGTPRTGSVDLGVGDVPSIAALEDGQFVVVHRRDTVGGPVGEVTRAVRLASDGTVLDDVILEDNSVIRIPWLPDDQQPDGTALGTGLHVAGSHRGGHSAAMVLNVEPT